MLFRSPGSHGIPEGVQTDRPGFSLCAAPLESTGPGFRGRRVDRMTEQRSGVYRTRDGGEDLTARGGVKVDNINGM